MIKLPNGKAALDQLLKNKAHQINVAKKQLYSGLNPLKLLGFNVFDGLFELQAR